MTVTGLTSSGPDWWRYTDRLAYTEIEVKRTPEHGVSVSVHYLGISENGDAMILLPEPVRNSLAKFLERLTKPDPPPGLSPMRLEGESMREFAERLHGEARKWDDE